MQPGGRESNITISYWLNWFLFRSGREGSSFSPFSHYFAIVFIGVQISSPYKNPITGAGERAQVMLCLKLTLLIFPDHIVPLSRVEKHLSSDQVSGQEPSGCHEHHHTHTHKSRQILITLVLLFSSFHCFVMILSTNMDAFWRIEVKISGRNGERV